MYVVDYERGYGLTPWCVYRIVPKGLVPSGRVYLVSFQSESIAQQYADYLLARK